MDFVKYCSLVRNVEKIPRYLHIYAYDLCLIIEDITFGRHILPSSEEKKGYNHKFLSRYINVELI